MNNFLIGTTLVWLTVISSIVSIGIPTPPVILETQCKRWSAILSWSPTGDESANQYKIQYKTNWDKDKWIDYGFKLPLREKHVRLVLSAWANYTFRVSSVNSIGSSNYSDVSETCMTEEDVPHKNPEDVYGRGNGPNNLVITWKPMPPLEQNAPGFFYSVFWKRNDILDAEWQHRNIPDWQTHRLLIENLPKLRPFKIKVEAHNSLGKAIVEAQEVIGFSDEDRPSEEPRMLEVVEIIDGNSAKLKWMAVDPKSLNGHFKGYKVEVWTDSYENRTEQIVSSNTTSALINVFTPGKVNSATVRAFNGAFDGPLSDTVTLNMTEDVYPDPPSFVWTRIRDQNQKAVIRITLVPNVTNENPGQKIYIRYRKKGIDSPDEWQNTFKENIEGVEQTTDLVNMDFEVFYEVQVVAESGKLSSFSNISMIDTHSYKWPTPTTTTTPSPPTTPSTRPPIVYPVSDPDIDPKNDGTQGEDNQTTDERTGADTEKGDKSSATPWIIALICVLAFICAFVGVFIYLKRRKTGGAEVNRKPNNTMNTTAHNGGVGPIRPNERDSFIVIQPSPDDRGHDEPDDDETDDPPREVYQGTTQSAH